MRTARPSRTPSPFRRSPLFAAVVAAVTAQQAFAACTPSAIPPNLVFCVTNTSASGPGSLAQAIANASAPGTCINTTPTIGFAIPGTGPFTISPSGTMSLFCGSGTMHATLDGTSQAGYTPNSDSTGFNSQIQIIVDGAAGPTTGISVNDFGYGASLTVKGVEFRNFTYGGFATALSGPINIYGSRLTNNVTALSVRGIDPDGFGAPYSTASVGGPNAADRNVFRGNSNASVDIGNPGYVNVTNNFIGTNDAGTAVAGGSGSGVRNSGWPNVAINNNVIGGSSGTAVTAMGSAVTVTGNKIGTSLFGGALPNGGSGIEAGGSPVFIGDNTIANNALDGITIPYGGNVEIRSNRIYANAGKAINLGVSPGQSYPTISSVVKDGTSTKINWSLTSTPSSNFEIDFFSNPASSTPPQATTYLDPTVLAFTPPGIPSGSTGAGGTISGTTVIPGSHDFITATATNDGLGITSELTAPQALAVGGVLTPTSINFGNVVVNASSGAQNAVINSIGASPYQISFLHGSNLCYGGPPAPPPICSSGGFICSTTCVVGQPYSAGSSCSISATFAPTVLGAQNTTIYICDNAGGNPRTLTLSGTGTAPPPPTVAPSSHDFGSVEVNIASTPQTFTVSNPSPTSITLSSFSITGPFQIGTTTCGTTIAANSSCAVDARFLPTVAGPASGAMSATASSGPVNFNLSGTGTAPPPPAVSPPTHNFGSLEVGGSSAAQTFTVNNPSLSPITLSAFAVTGPYQIVSTTCGASMAAGASCTVGARFMPTAAGPATGVLSATASSGAVSASLSGTGTPSPAPALSPPSIDFGSVQLGGQSSAGSFTLTNPALLPVTLSSFSVTPPFALVSSTCTSSLAPGASCTADVKFVPATLGAASGAISNATGRGSVSAGLAGNGSASPAATITPVNHNFGPVFIGTSSSPQTFTISNPGLLPVTLTLPTVTPPFALLSTTCGSSLPAGSSCTADVKFSPSAVGAATGTVSSTAGANAVTASLAGAGSPLPPATIAPAAMDFGSVFVGTSSASTAFTIKNPAPLPVNLSPVAVTPPFSLLSTTCGTSLPAGTSCVANVKFSPSAVGPAAGSVSATTGSGPVLASLTGNGATAPPLAITPPSFDFGTVLLGFSSPATAFQIKNPASVTLTLSALGTTGPFQVVSTDCATLEANQSCTANVRFTPREPNLAQGSLSVASQFGTSSANLQGSGLRQPAIELATDPIEFGSLVVGTPPVQRTLRITSTGNDILGINGITITRPFTLANACGVSLAPGDSCTFTVGFDPAEIGDFDGTVAVSTNAPNASSLSIRVHAQVQARPEPVVRVSPRVIGFGDRVGGTQSPAQRITLTNEGGVAANLTLSLDSPQFVVINSSCGATLAPQRSCATDVAFQPQGFGPRRGQYVVSSNSPDSPIRVELSGAGCRPVQVTQGRGTPPNHCAP